MTNSLRLPGRIVSALLLPVLLTPVLRAQVAPPPRSTEESQPVALDPFQVQETSDQSYGALNSNSITAFNTALDKLPVSADVFDSAFMKDTAFTSVEQMLDFYSAGSGQSSTAPDLAAQNGQALDRPSNATFSVRGLAAPTSLVNGFFPSGLGVTGGGLTSNFDLDKVEIINGPQALLYGVSGAGGAINLTTKQARLGVPSFCSLKFQVDQYGHKLGELDYGGGNDYVALRLAVIDQTLGGRRVNIGGPMSGDYAQIALRPLRNTVIRVTGEQQVFDRLYQTYQPTDPDAADYKGARWIVRTLADTIAKGGNLEIGVGPDGTGRFHPLAVEQLREAGVWIAGHSAAIYSTRPRPGALWQDGPDVRYTQTKDGRTLYAFLLDWPGRTLILHGMGSFAGSEVALFGQPGRLPARQQGSDLAIDLGSDEPRSPDLAYVVKLDVRASVSR